MPRRTDIHSILIIGAGPIVIGQACEFDYSGAQACKALRAEGYRVILVNSNPATIMTDPGLADATYIEPITPDIVEKIIAREKPDALLPTMGGQTALNTAMRLHASGALARHGVELISARADVIDRAEDRLKFRDAMSEIGLESPRSAIAHSMAEAREALATTGLPAVIRPSFTLAGTGGGIAYNRAEFEQIVAGGLDASPTDEVLIEESVLGWKEYEMEVVRDSADNCIIVCAIENVDPMGIHTGDSVTVAPALTLTDKEYQVMRNASIACLRKIGVDTGGSNVQFAVNPADGRLVVIEMNPRVSRSSALASKATGFPIAKIAAKLAVGYTLDELANDITSVVIDGKRIGSTPASFEPTIDYVVVKIPRFTFEKFPGTPALLTTSMKSVGETMAVGRSFAEALQKGLRSMETGYNGLDPVEPPGDGGHDAFRAALSTPRPDRLLMAAQALRAGLSVEDVHDACKFDPWFLRQLERIVHAEPDAGGGHRFRCAAGEFGEADVGEAHRLQAPHGRGVGGKPSRGHIAFGVNDALQLAEEPRVELAGVVDVLDRQPRPQRLRRHQQPVGPRGGQGRAEGVVPAVARRLDRIEAVVARLHAAQALLQRLREAAADRHGLADRLHAGGQQGRGAGELLKREPGNLDDNVVDRRLEACWRRASDVVGQLVKRVSHRKLGRDLGDGEAGCLRRQGRGARHPRVHLDDDQASVRGVDRELHVGAAGVDADLAQARDAGVAHDLVLFVGERQRRGDRHAVAGVDAHWVDVLDGAHDDAVVGAVAHDLHLVLLPAEHAFLNENLVRRAGVEAAGDDLLELLAVVGDAAAGAGQGEARADDGGQPGYGERGAGLGHAVGDGAARAFEADLAHGVAELQPVLGAVDDIGLGADQLDAVALQRAVGEQLHGGVERGLPAHGWQQGVRPLADDDFLHDLRGDRLDVGGVGQAGVGHDGGRVRVDQDDAVALCPQRFAGLGAGVVEFAGLADDDWPGADDQDGFDVGAFRHG